MKVALLVLLGLLLKGVVHQHLGKVAGARSNTNLPVMNGGFEIQKLLRQIQGYGLPRQTQLHTGKRHKRGTRTHVEPTGLA